MKNSEEPNKMVLEEESDGNGEDVQSKSDSNSHMGNKKKNHNNSSDIQKPSMWIPNDATEECTICKSYFNLFRRKHHCRNCGM